MIRKETYRWRPGKSQAPPSQAECILADLRKGKKITPLDALEDYGCFRLGARIWDLRKDGHPIKMELFEDRRKGKRYARYWL